MTDPFGIFNAGVPGCECDECMAARAKEVAKAANLSPPKSPLIKSVQCVCGRYSFIKILPEDEKIYLNANASYKDCPDCKQARKSLEEWEMERDPHPEDEEDYDGDQEY